MRYILLLLLLSLPACAEKVSFHGLGFEHPVECIENDNFDWVCSIYMRDFLHVLKENRENGCTRF